MHIEDTNIEGLKIITPRIFEDERGYFFESFSDKYFKGAGIDYNFVQDNQSFSESGVLRGLHFQNPPFAQGKLVRVIKGAVLDVVVDIRKKSATYGQHLKIELSEENMTMLWVPPGFAHGFLTLKDNTIFFYKCTNIYNKESEGSILWNDLDLNIDWAVENPKLSVKDITSPSFKDFNSLF
jgi:dTDP-4-dehydrorhamnose 3,5-epimerase